MHKEPWVIIAVQHGRAPTYSFQFSVPTAQIAIDRRKGNAFVRLAWLLSLFASAFERKITGWRIQGFSLLLSMKVPCKKERTGRTGYSPVCYQQLHRIITVKSYIKKLFVKNVLQSRPCYSSGNFPYSKSVYTYSK